MPLYEYQCEVCGHRFEVIQRFSDAPLEECPKCGGRVHKLQSAPAFHLKGSGWYITDYARKDQGTGEKDAAPKTGEAAKAGDGNKAEGSKAAGSDTTAKKDSTASEKSNEKSSAPAAASTSPPATKASD